MHTPAETPPAEPRPPGLKPAVDRVKSHAQRLAGLEAELASLELKRKLGALGAGVGMLVGAALVAVYGLGFLLATIAAALATFLDTWLALLIVAVVLVLVAGLLAMLGIRQVRKGTPPVPEQALEEARKTSEALKSDGTP